MTTPLRVPDDELHYDENLIYTWRGALFTGVAYEHGPHGILSEVAYFNGSQQGVATDTNPEGLLLSEDTYYENSRHGLSRTFEDHGRVTRAAWYEYNILVRSAERDGMGDLVWRDAVRPGSPEAQLLDRWRRELAWPEPEPPSLR